MIAKIIFLIFALTCIAATPINDCTAILKTAGVSERFPGVVAHGIHSMNVQQLRLFKSDVTEKNSIPTINMDLTDNAALLPNAPDIAVDGPSFKTDGMRAVDRVLSHMDNSKYDIKLYKPLERLVHALHMQEVWFETRVEFEKIKLNPPSVDVCRCARDVENNGIMKMMRFIALEIREPGLMYGKHTQLNNGTVTWDGNVYNYRNFPHKDTDMVLQNAEDVVPPLETEAAWAHWKKLMVTMPMADDYELALYLYCALNVEVQK